MGTIVVTSFFFIGKDAVKDETKVFIQEIITHQQSEVLSNEDNEEIRLFFQSINDLDLPHPVIEGVEIPYYDVFTPPIENNKFLQYISVKYDQVTSSVYDTDIHLEYILYNELTGNPQEIYFGKLTVRSIAGDSTKEVVSVYPMEKQK